MSAVLIMLVGGIGSGKSTSAQILTECGFKEISFATPIKEFAKSIGFEHKEIYGTQQEKLVINKFWGVSGREFMQKFGSEVCRDYLPKIIPNMNMNSRTLWARVVEKTIMEQSFVVISDGRFKDEADLVRQNGGIIVRIERNTLSQKNTNQPQSDEKKHKSEQEINDIKADFVIQNNGTLAELEEKLLAILSSRMPAKWLKTQTQAEIAFNNLGKFICCVFIGIVAISALFLKKSY